MALSNDRNYCMVYDGDDHIYNSMVKVCQRVMRHNEFPGGWWCREFGKFLMLSFANDIDANDIDEILASFPKLTPYEAIDLSRLTAKEVEIAKKWIKKRWGDGKLQWRLEDKILAIFDIHEDLVTEFKLTWL